MTWNSNVKLCCDTDAIPLSHCLGLDVTAYHGNWKSLERKWLQIIYFRVRCWPYISTNVSPFCNVWWWFHSSFRQICYLRGICWPSTKLRNALYLFTTATPFQGNIGGRRVKNLQMWSISLCVICKHFTVLSLWS